MRKFVMLLLVAAAMVGMAGASSLVSLYSPQTVGLGETFDVRIESSNPDLAAMQITISGDKNIVEFVDFVEGEHVLIESPGNTRDFPFVHGHAFPEFADRHFKFGTLRVKAIGCGHNSFWVTNVIAVDRDVNRVDFQASSAGVDVACAPVTGDLNGDRRVDRTDLKMFIESWVNHTLAGDLNGDGQVDILDLAILEKNWT